MDKVASVSAKKPFFRRDPLTTVLLTAGIFFGSQLLAVILAGTVPGFRGWTEQQAIDWLKSSTGAQFIVMLLVAVFAILAVYYLLKYARILPARIGVVRPRWRDVGYAAVAYLLYFASYFVMVILASALFSSFNANQPQDIGFDQVQGGAAILMAFLSLVILPPLWEETVFRGFLFSSLRAKFRLRYAIIATSLVFGIAHLEFGSGGPLVWVAALDTFILSCYLCCLREKTGGLWAPMLLHAAKNFIAFYFLFLR